MRIDASDASDPGAPRAPETDTCGCSDGVAASTPSALFNRAGLSAIDYRIGRYAQFNASLRAGLSSTAFPELNDLRTRDTDDYSIGLLDAVACVADVLTFYQERLANESYLRTATERVSLQEMAKLIGYALRPGVAAETRLAFALEPPKTAPPNLSADPGAFVTGIPATLTLASGLKVQSVPGPGESPQTFETVEEITARPEWNAIRPWLSAPRVPQSGDLETWIDAANANLKPGDALVFVDPAFFANPTSDSNYWDFRRIDAIEPDIPNGRIRVIWKDPLSAASALQAYALRKRAAIFGHNAPRWSSMTRQFHRGYPGGANATEWPEFTISAARRLGNYVDLDAVFSEVKAGGLALLTRFGGDSIASGSTVTFNGKGISARATDRIGVITTTPTELYRVDSATDVSLAAFALSGKVTRIGVAGRNFDTSFFNASNAVRETSAYVQSELLKLTPYRVTDAVLGSILQLAVAPDGFIAGRKLIVTGLRVDNASKVVHQATVVAALADPNGTLLTITPPLPSALQRDSVVVHANVADATHGETVAQILGAGDAGKQFQRFEVKRVPLTYRSAPNETGAASELSVRVGDIEWLEKSTLYGSAPGERVYTLSTDEQGKTWVVCGDGVRGARLPSGVNNVRASYRQGLGQGGNVAADRLTQLLTRPLGLKSVSNPIAAQGGTDAEPADQARRTMPLGTRTLGRVVSLLDYEDFAMAYTGIAKAQAQVLQLPGGAVIAITVAGQGGASLAPTDPVRNNLLQALKNSGDPHVRVVLLSYLAAPFCVGLKVKRDPAYALKPLLAAVEAALRARYGFDARMLAQPVLQSDVIATAHSVAGVVAVDLDFLYRAASPSTRPSRQTRLLAARMQVRNGVAIAAELLTLQLPLVRLEEMP